MRGTPSSSVGRGPVLETRTVHLAVGSDLTLSALSEGMPGLWMTKTLETDTDNWHWQQPGSGLPNLGTGKIETGNW